MKHFEAAAGNKEYATECYIALAKEISGIHEVFPFPGIDPEADLDQHILAAKTFADILKFDHGGFALRVQDRPSGLNPASDALSRYDRGRG